MDRPEQVPAAPSLKRVLMPTEHGSWAFLAEPILLGSLVAFSGAGVAIAAAALAAFLARPPLRLVVMDRAKGRRHPRTILAERVFTVCALLAALALALAATSAKGRFLIPLALAAPLAAASLALDLGRRSREAVTEVAGVVALGAISASIALAGEWGLGPALGLWVVLAARAVPTVLYVRARVRLDRGEPTALGPPLVAHALALAVVALLAFAELAPGWAVGALGLLALRCAHGLSPLRVPMSMPMLGVSELAFGLLTVFVTAWGIARGA